MKHKPLLIISAIVVFSCAGFLTYTLAQGEGEITICVSKVGTVRLVGDGYFSSKCNKGEKLVTLSLQGIQGPQGEQGIQGEQGPVGPEGPRGEPGPKGDTGLQGEQGIQGEQGLRGIQGEQGLQGEKGDKGDTGEQGPIGLTGSSLKVVDNNNQPIGFLIDISYNEWKIWDTQNKKVVTGDPLNGFQNTAAASINEIYYTGSNCNSEPLVSGARPYYFYKMVSGNPYGWNYVHVTGWDKVHRGTGIPVKSTWDLSGCHNTSYSHDNLSEISPTITPSYNVPLTLADE